MSLRPLKSGDKIGVIAPSSPVSGDIIPKVRDFLEEYGFRVEFGESVFLSMRGYLSGSARKRADDINSFFKRKDISAIWCIRGGAGGIGVLEHLDYDTIKNNPKPFIGFSDITVFHSAFNRLSSLPTFHGPMLWRTGIKENDDFNMSSLFSALSLKEYVPKNPENEPLITLSPGNGEGVSVGGNLSLLCSLMKTPYEPDYMGKILFLEDVDEPVSRLETMLYTMKYAGVFNKISALVLCTFENCENSEDHKFTANELFREFFCDFNKPVLSNFSAGHCKKQCTVPMGVYCAVNTQKSEIRFFR